MTKVRDLFYVFYGVDLELNALEESPNGINFVSRTSQNNGVSARVKPVKGLKANPARTISVAAGGSVMEAFLQIEPYYSGRDLFYLKPKKPMSNEVLLYYCACLKSNKFKYSYGRQANATLEDLKIPSLKEAEIFVGDFSIEMYGHSLIRSLEFDLSIPSQSCNDEGDLVMVEKLFDVVNGISSNLVERSSSPENPNWVPYIRPSYRQSTSIDAYVNKKIVPSAKVFPKETLYVSTDGQGSHTYSYVSTTEFVPNSNVVVLLPKRTMSTLEKLYYALCITNNRYKYSYGRKPKGDRIKQLKVPKRIPTRFLEISVEDIVEGFVQNI